MLLFISRWAYPKMVNKCPCKMALALKAYLKTDFAHRQIGCFNQVFGVSHAFASNIIRRCFIHDGLQFTV